ncbi:hypothetical protein GCM10009843_34560 [Nocardioides bigeumensis]|uniref:Uncharacterized protein n=1 Tax=Nocardioides bigeumensis TaxID=433657 RepID=A0ABP5KHL8_9ACTN
MRRSLRQTSALFLLAPLAAAATALTPGATALASPTSDSAQAVETKAHPPGEPWFHRQLRHPTKVVAPWHVHVRSLH